MSTHRQRKGWSKTIKGGKLLKGNHEEQKCEVGPNGKIGIHKQSAKEEIMSITIDPKSIPRTYRDYLKKMVEMGEFFEIDDEIDWNLEMGA